MSKIALTPNASGTGTLTIAAPNTSTDRTLTLPDSTGTIDTLGRAGNVLQVVESTSIDTTYIASTSFQDLDLNVSITPSSSSSKILIMVSGAYTQDGVDNTLAYIQLVRDSTAIASHLAGYDTPGGNVGFDFYIQKLDSPATTSAITYKLQARTDNASSTFRPQGSGASIIAMEIAA